MDKTLSGTAVKQLVMKAIPYFKDALKFTFLEDLDMSEVLERVKKLPHDSIVYLLTLTTDKSGNTFSLKGSCALISRNSAVPVYSNADAYLGHGIVGGMLDSGYAQGKKAGEMALRILHGEKVKDIPVVKKSPNRYEFDYHQMQRFGIKLSSLPKGSTVINRPYSFYSEHKRLAWAVIASIVGLVLIISILSTNIIKRKRAERAQTESETRLAESNQLLAGVLDHTHMMAVFLDPRFNFIWVNRAYADTCKHEPSFFPSKNHFDLYPHEENQAIFQRVVGTGEPFFVAAKPFEFSDQPERGVTYWDWSLIPLKDGMGKVAGLVFTLAEVTERIRAEEALQKSEEKYRSMMESMDDAVYICSPDYNVEYMNPTMIKKTGGRDAVGEPCYKVIHGLDEKCQWCVHDKVQQGENCVTEIDNPRDNRAYNVSHFPIHNADGSISKLTIYRDVTEIRKMEAQFQQITKMDAIATLAGGVAHEFNNTLMGIMGNIELLKINFSGDGGIDKHLEPMKSAGHRMSHLTAQLLAYAEGGKYQPKDLKLDDFVIETLPILQHNLSPTVRVETVFPKDISHIKADHAQMQMVLSAILANSDEAIEDEGIIRITAENKGLDENFIKQHPGLEPGLYVSLIIEDDGKGMDEETRRRIFEPFFTTKFQGRGMGMAAVYGIVMNHDGGIYVDSELGKGTVVQIYLPAIEIEVEKRKKAKADVTTGSGTILMIEDEDVVIEVTQAMLEMLGYRVMVAKTGKDAIHIAETFDGQIDLALLDIKLPDMEGGKAYPLIMKARPELKVIVFSGYSIDGPARMILDAGAQDFLQKPFSIATLSEKLKEVLEGK